MSPERQVFLDLANAGFAVALTVGCLLAVVLGMAFVRALW